MVALTGLFPWVEASTTDARYAYWAAAWEEARAAGGGKRGEALLVAALCDLAGKRLPSGLARLLVPMLSPAPEHRPTMDMVVQVAGALGPHGDAAAQAGTSAGSPSV